MLDNRRKQRLEGYIERKKFNLCRNIYVLHRFMNEWAESQWKADGWENIRPDHLRLISIVADDSVSNNELARRAGVSKQAMSKMVADLERHGFIDVQPDPNDSRAKIISMSNSGVDFLEYFQTCNKPIEKQFREIIGEEKTEKLREILSELAEGLIKIEGFKSKLTTIKS